MSRPVVWLLHLANFLVGGTGLVYAWMLYFLEPTDPYAVAHHPFQPQVQHLHVWTAPVLVFALGLVWLSHAWRHWTLGVSERRRSGAAMLACAAPMVLSGYFLQTAVEEGWRQTWLTVHLLSSAIWIAAYLGHLLSARKSR
ncbi:MAG: hypothetical protein HC897_14880 [Thermoanaerobaculia bacterium]|nr:hypothetical protein [Thermoanaerobaculia bacterium]